MEFVDVKTIRTKYMEHISNYDMPLDGMATEKEKKLLGKRLSLTRRALGYDTQARWCKALSSTYPMTPQRWNNYETGDLGVTLPVALALCERFDLSLDWIYRGSRHNLHPDIRAAIEVQEIEDREGS